MYPSESDINDALTSMGLATRSSAVIDAARFDAIERWQTETGYRPFLADDRSFQLTRAVNGVYRLPVPCIQLYQVAINWEPLSLGQDFMVLTDGSRIWGLRVAREVPEGQVVQVDGYFGYSETADAFVQRALVNRTVLSLLERDRAGQLADGVHEWRQGDEAVTYEDKAMAELVSWAACPKGREDSFGGATYHYKNMGVFF